MLMTPSTPTKTASMPTKTARTSNIDLRCFVAMHFFCEFTHFSGIQFTGQKCRGVQKNDKYKVWVSITLVRDVL